MGGSKWAKWTLIVLVAATFLGAGGLQAAEQKFPNRPINFYVPFPPGGFFDLVSRPMCEYAGKVLGQPVIVVNKAGASGTLAPAMLKTMPPDGYNVSVNNLSLFTMPPQQEVNFDPLKDFTYICRTVDAWVGIVVKADSPWKTLKELVAYAKANPGKVKYGTANPRGGLHFAMVLIGQKEGVQWEMVPFMGGQLVVTALLGGHVQAISQGPEWAPHVESGALRLLAVLGEQRFSRFPDVPCTGELGYNIGPNCLGIVGPPGMPKDITDLLDKTFKASLADPATLKVKEQMFLYDMYQNSADYTKWAKEQVDFYKKFVKEVGLDKPDKQ
jgi:tripartite-type tricarboxylate transporter receptor subunit TctC